MTCFDYVLMKIKSHSRSRFLFKIMFLHTLIFNHLHQDVATACDPFDHRGTFARICNMGTPLSPSLKERLSEEKDNADNSIWLPRPME